MKIKREDIRNIAIIAHVDHGKTTLVDQLLKQSGVFRANQEVEERVMDSNDIERERGITILSKNTAVFYKGVKINIIDTPGHADFGGEVERVLKMVDGVVLVVDAFEGPMPQTKFVLQKALDLDLRVIVCINKIDRPEARPEAVIDETLELFMDLDASDEQLDCPFVYASARAGFAKKELDDPEVDMSPLFETIIDYIPEPEGDPDAETQVLISTIDYNEFVGRIGIGKIDSGSLKLNQDCVIVNHHDPDKMKKVKIGKLYVFDGLKRVEVQSATIGEIVAISGIPDIHIGDTLCSPEKPEAIPFQKISEPTISMNFMVNDSPLAGQEGKFITSRHIRERLMRELNTQGWYQVSGWMLEQLRAVFGCGCCDDAGAAEVIGRVWREHKYLCDPHTAVAWAVAEKHTREGVPMVVLSTASPYKFPAAVLHALGEAYGDDEFAMMEQLHALTGMDIPKNLRGLEGRPVLHTDVIDKDAMLDYVLSDVLK